MHYASHIYTYIVPYNNQDRLVIGSTHLIASLAGFKWLNGTKFEIWPSNAMTVASLWQINTVGAVPQQSLAGQ